MRKNCIFKTRKQRCNGRKRYRGYNRRLNVIISYSKNINLDKDDFIDLDTKRWGYVGLMMSMLVNGGGKIKCVRPGVYSIIGLKSKKYFNMIFIRKENQYILYHEESENRENIVL
jgi:hypothetical protein